VGVRAMAKGLLGNGQEDELPVLDAMNFAFGNPEIGRIDEIIGGIDVQDVSLNGFKFGGRIVVSGRIDGVEEIVGIESTGEANHRGSEKLVRGIASGKIFPHVQGSAAGDDEEIGGDLQSGTRLRRVVPIFPVGVLADAVNDHFPPDAIAASNLHRQAGEGHEGVHEVDVGFGPDPGMHTAHGGAKDEAKVVDTQSFVDKFVLEGDHVRVFVMREMGMETVARLAGFAVADVVGKNQKIFCCVEELAGTEKPSGENGLKKIAALATGAVKDQDRVGGATGRVFHRCTEGEVVEANVGKRLARLEMEIVDGVVALLCGGPVLRGIRCRLSQDGTGTEKHKESDRTECGVRAWLGMHQSSHELAASRQPAIRTPQVKREGVYTDFLQAVRGVGTS
jgi:hypothetical protein